MIFSSASNDFLNLKYSDELYHHGIKGQKWGIRRYQNPDGTLTAEGKKRYSKNGTFEKSYKSRMDYLIKNADPNSKFYKDFISSGEKVGNGTYHIGEKKIDGQSPVIIEYISTNNKKSNDALNFYKKINKKYLDDILSKSGYDSPEEKYDLVSYTDEDKTEPPKLVIDAFNKKYTIHFEFDYNTGRLIRTVG